MNQQYSPLSNLEMSELNYIYREAPVSSPLWREAASQLAAKQMVIQGQMEAEKQGRIF